MSLEIENPTAPENPQVTPEQSAQPQLSEHEQAMIQKAKENRGEVTPEDPQVTPESPETTEQPEETAAKAERPDWLPEEYWDAETGKPKEEFSKLFDKSAEEQPEVTPEDKSSFISEISKAIDETGQISDEQYKQLEDAGISRDYVDAYVEGLAARNALVEAKREIAEMKAFSIVGSKEEYAAMSQWALDNLSEAEVKAFNEQVGKDELFESAITQLYKRYTEAEGFEGNRMFRSNSAEAGEYIKNKAELLARMSNPEYASNEAYRKKVAQDIQFSRKAGYNPYA